MTYPEKAKEKEGKRRVKKSENRTDRNKGVLTVFLKNGVVGGSKECGFIGLICFWAKNEGKNEQKLAIFCIFLSKMNGF